jgi:hypothetical protein
LIGAEETRQLQQNAMIVAIAFTTCARAGSSELGMEQFQIIKKAAPDERGLGNSLDQQLSCFCLRR